MLTRRAMLTSTPALALAVATPAIAQGNTAADFAAAPSFATDTPILALFREWAAFEWWLNTGTKGMPEDEFTDLVDKSCRMAERIGELDTTCPRDFAAKYLALTTWGNGTLNGEVYDWDATLAEEAASLLGSTVADLKAGGVS